MSLSVLKMYCKKGNTTYPVDLYTSSQETGTQTNLCKKIVIGTQSKFFRLSSYLQNGAAGGDTPIRVKLNDTVYKVTQHGEFKITITPAENQTITCTANGITWTSGTKWFPYGTQWTATIKGHAGYNPGTLNVSSGILTNKDVTVTATAATVAYASCTMKVSVYKKGYICTGFTPSTIKDIQFNRLTTEKGADSLDVLVTNGAGRHAIMLVGGISLDMTFPSDGCWKAPYRQDLVDYLGSHIGQTAPIQILVY